jgi:hypothetical protein
MLYNLRVLKAGTGTEKNLYKFWKYQAEFLEMWFDHLEAKAPKRQVRQVRQRKIKMPPPPKMVDVPVVEWMPAPLCWD